MDEPPLAANLRQGHRPFEHDDNDSRYRTLVGRSADGVLVLRPGGVVCFANAAAGEILGRRAEDLPGTAFGTPVVPGETTEIDIPRPDGDLRVAELRAAEIRWEGEPACLVSLRDITTHQRAEDSLRLLGEVSRVLVASLDQPTLLGGVARVLVPYLADYCLIDRVCEDGTLVAETAAHADRDQEARLRARQGASFADGRRPEPAVAQVLNGTGPVTFPAPSAATADAGEFEPPSLVREFGYQSYLLVPLLVRERVLYVMTLVFAQSERRYRPEDVALADEVAHRTAMAVENARLFAAAQDAVRRRDEFLAMLGHELRNPLAPILHAVRLLGTRGPGQPSDRHARDVIERQAQHMSRLLDDLLDVSRVTHGKIELRKQEVDLREVITDAVAASRPLMDRRSHQLILSVPGAPLWVEGDPTRLEQILVNLLNNAAKYTDPGGQVTLIASREGRDAVVRVVDTGRGMAPEVLPHVFDLFTQADAERDPAQGGLGIGLTLVRRLVELHGGSISATSPGPGRGSEFRVSLPLSAGHSPTDSSAAPLAPAAPAKARRILLVEDYADSRDMLRELIEAWGHEVEVAEDGVAGLDKAMREPFDVLLVDINLPKLNGYQIAERLRSAPHRERMWVVALTGYGQANDRRRALAAGFDAHLVKPVNLDHLAEVLANGAPQRPQGERQA